MRNSVFAAVLSLLLASLPALAQPKAQPAQPLSGEAIAAIWKERQDKVKTATFETTRKTLWARDSLTKDCPLLFLHPDYFKTGVKKKIHDGPVPVDDYRVTTKERLTLDGVKVRYDFTSIQWDSSTKELYLRPQRSAFDGKHYRELIVRRTGEEGVQSTSSAYPDANLLAINTIMISFRGRIFELSRVKPGEFVATGRRAVIDGHESFEYRVWEVDGATRHSWLCPARDWNIVRDVQRTPKQSGDVEVAVLERRYKPDETVGWVPASWEYSHVAEGQLRSSERIEVNSYTINAAIEPSEFELPFTTGMKVFNNDPGGGVGTIQTDGRLLPDDGRPAYFLPGTGEPAGRKWLRYGLYVLTALLASLLTWRMIRRYRKLRSIVPPTSPASEGVLS